VSKLPGKRQMVFGIASQRGREAAADNSVCFPQYARNTLRDEGETLPKNTTPTAKAGPAKGPKKSAGQVSAVRNEQLVFCRDDARLNEVLKQLHQVYTQNPVARVQREIDRYLVATHVVACGLPAHTCVEDFILDASTTLDVHSLPDMMRVFRCRLITGQWINSLQESICRYTIPCMHKTRFLNRNAPENSDGDTDTIVYIQIAIGLLLGLYPLSSKKPPFALRMRMFMVMQQLLTSPLATQQRFIVDHINVFRLAMAEYFVHCLVHFLPVEKSLLGNHLDIEAYINLCHSSCEIFRANCAQCTDLSWENVEQFAYRSNDKIIRSTKISSKLSLYVPTHHTRIKKFITENCNTDPTFLDGFVDLVRRCPTAHWHSESPHLYQLLVRDLLPEIPVLATIANNTSLPETVCDVHSIFASYNLPENITREQVYKLQEKFQHDRVKLLHLTNQHFCLHCVLKMTPKQFLLEERINGLRRQSLNVHGKISCNRCMRAGGNMICVNIIGRLLRINRDYYSLCTVCCKVHRWVGDGLDLENCCEAPKPKLCLTKPWDDEDVDDPLKGIFDQKLKRRLCCFVCNRNCGGKMLSLLHANTAQIININLCSRHHPQQFMLKFLLDTDAFCKWLFHEKGISLSN